MVILAVIVLNRKKNNSMIKKPNNTNITEEKTETIRLPAPDKTSPTSLEEAIANRRSRRDFKDQPLSQKQISQLLWSAQGITDKNQGFRTAPSAGALYPLEIYIVVKDKGAGELNSGVYHYLPESHALEMTASTDLSRNLAKACLNQSFIGDAPVSLVITAEYSRVTNKYGDRGQQYVQMEAGHAAQNVYLQSESLGLGTVTVGAFNNNEIVNLLQIPPEYEPLYVIPIGYPTSD